MGFIFLLHPLVESVEMSVQCRVGCALPCPLAGSMAQWDAAQFGMKNAQAGKVGFNLKWDVMNNQQEEQELGTLEAGGKFLSEKPTQALSLLKEKSAVCFFPSPWGLSEAFLSFTWLFFMASVCL